MKNLYCLDPMEFYNYEELSYVLRNANDFHSDFSFTKEKSNFQKFNV